MIAHCFTALKREHEELEITFRKDVYTSLKNSEGFQLITNR